MILEKINFYSIIGLILIFIGILSLIWGYIIPTKFVPINTTVSLGFEIAGILFIIIGISLFALIKKRT